MPRVDARTVTAPPRAVAEPEMLLVFRLSGEVFALAVTSVNEILDPMPRTEVPNAPAFAPALINVRGAVAPLIDIRQRLRMQPAPASEDARVIVLELPVNGAPTKLAMFADSVDEVIEADLGALESVPELGARWPEIYVKGVVRHGGGLVVILDAETLFRPDADRPSPSADMRN